MYSHPSSAGTSNLAVSSLDDERSATQHELSRPPELGELTLLCLGCWSSGLYRFGLYQKKADPPRSSSLTRSNSP